MDPLDSGLLRTFLAIASAGSVTGGAERIHRSQSATSLQIQQLEDILGRPVFHRHGRGVTLTAAGERLLPVARRVTAALDAAVADLRGETLTGTLRIGLPEDHGRTALARIIADFAALHPDVDLRVQSALGDGFGPAVARGALDVAVHEVAEPGTDVEVLRTERLAWMAARDHDLPSRNPLPVAIFDRDCWWRDVALSSLEDAGRRYRVVFASESAAGVRAAVASGIAAGLLGETDETRAFARLPGLPVGPSSHLVLRTGPGLRGPACTAMCSAIRRAFRT